MVISDARPRAIYIGTGVNFTDPATKTSDAVLALDPDQQSKVVWETRIGHGGPQGGVLWGAARDDRLAYFLSDWDPTKPESGGGVFALEIATSNKAWSTPAPKPACLGVAGCSAAQPGAPTVITGVVFAGSLDGHLRAYDSKSGGIIWDVDTLHDFETVNSIKARGGSMNGTGPTIAGRIPTPIPATLGFPPSPVMCFWLSQWPENKYKRILIRM